MQSCVDPYIQVAEVGRVCEFTGLPLTDIWRYFRHTWNTSYNSTPGRKIWFLVRDRSVGCHPVVGIAALGNSIVQLSPRDEWIGWTPDAFLQKVREEPTGKWGAWLLRSLANLIGDIYTDDLTGILGSEKDEITAPSAAAIRRLELVAAKCRRKHRSFPGRTAHKKATTTMGAPDWVGEAKSYLFRAKRASTLAQLLSARRALQVAGFDSSHPDSLSNLSQKTEVAGAIRTVLRLVKAAHVGVDMLDLTICGAIAPYNALLGGKLVALLMASPEVRQTYAAKYRRASSIIASAMAGRGIRRPPRLVLIGTTSLYGRGSSQYNRIRMPAEAALGPKGDSVSYVQLGHTRGYGSFHFSRETLRALDLVIARSRLGRQVNSIFGEGVNPKLRKVRGALEVIGLRADTLLQHGSPRIIYAVPLARNFREVLLGLDSKPSYVIPNDEHCTAAIVAYWRSRWLAARIERSEVIDAVRSHATTYPFRHGARVTLPELHGESGPLFTQHEDA